MNVPPAQFKFDCAKIGVNPITLYSPILYTNPVTGETKRDSVKVELSGTDGQITAVVDCPDVEVMKETRHTTITLQPTIKDWLVLAVVGIGGVLVGLGFSRLTAKP